MNKFTSIQELLSTDLEEYKSLYAEYINNRKLIAKAFNAD